MTDDLWDAMEEMFGPVRTASERGRRNRAVRELRQAGATVSEIQQTFRYCQRQFTTFGEMAICGNLTRATNQQQPSVNLLDELRKRRETR